MGLHCQTELPGTGSAVAWAALPAVCPTAVPHSWHCLFQELGKDLVFTKPNIYWHFTQGMGEPKYLPVPSWLALNKLLEEALDNYNEVNTAMSLVSALLWAALCHGSACTMKMQL